MIKRPQFLWPMQVPSSLRINIVSIVYLQSPQLGKSVALCNGFTSSLPNEIVGNV